MIRIVVSGYMLRFPLAGNVLAYLQYVIGLRRLGHHVVYLEESAWTNSSYDPVTTEWSEFPEYGLRYVRGILRQLGEEVPVWFVNSNQDRADGPGPGEVERLLAQTDLVLNLGGVTWMPEFELACRRALVDMDPLFAQVKGFSSGILGDYDTHFSYGANIGRPFCPIPTRGCRWIPTRPPVVEDLWPVRPDTNRGFTTVANWSAYGEVEHDGRRYGQKDREFLRLLALPGEVPVKLELALTGAEGPVRARFRDAGWSIVDGADMSLDLATYRDYISTSLGELSAAKHAYVETRSGWFSDRSVCYLACGRPAVLQDTGFSSLLPCGTGLMAFRSVDDAAAAIADVIERYPEHRQAAREIAVTHFGYRHVLPPLIDAALGGVPAARAAEARA